MGLPRCMMVPAFGITGGISKGVAYFVTDAGSRLPPGICAKARGRNLPCVEAYSAAAPTADSFKKPRLLIMCFILSYEGLCLARISSSVSGDATYPPEGRIGGKYLVLLTSFPDFLMKNRPDAAGFAIGSPQVPPTAGIGKRPNKA